MKDVIDLIGRIFIAFIFLYEAYDSIKYFKQTKEMMTDYGLTWRQDLLLLGAITFLIIGGILVLIGYRTTLGAGMLLAYYIPVTMIVHSFWNDPEDIRRMESIMFMKNLAVIGGLMIVMVNDSGRYSIKRLFATTRVPSARRG
ncbi:MAG: DoxX family protein [Bacteroidia bacterium]|nr:DoxX family protein [Bacteroidia bacterium]